MQMIFYRPLNPTLQKYMEGYYFVSEDRNNNIIQYKTFPNNYSILSVAHNADVLFEDGKITVTPAITNKISVDLVLRYTEPISVVYAKAIDEITFYFKPLGLNQFIPESNFISANKSIMDFHVFTDFNSKMLEIFKLKDRKQQIEVLENYWLSKLQIKEFSLMEKLVLEIETSDLKIDEIAKKFNFTRQYINKLFLKHIGKSPSEYRKIHRFRNAIKQVKDVRRLKELTFENIFYDQSHFNKNFKELTQSSPSSFFKNVDTDKENVWLFI